MLGINMSESIYGNVDRFESDSDDDDTLPPPLWSTALLKQKNTLSADSLDPPDELLKETPEPSTSTNQAEEQAKNELHTFKSLLFHGIRDQTDLEKDFEARVGQELENQERQIESNRLAKTKKKIEYFGFDLSLLEAVSWF
jgi:hypothetical protein